MTIDWQGLAVEGTLLDVLPAGLRATARRRRFAKGETLYRQGQRPEAMLYLMSGELRLVRYAPGGTEIVLQRVRSGFVAEASLEAEYYHCSVVAGSDGELLAFPRTTFRAALEGEPAFAHAWAVHLAREVRRLRTRCERLSLNSAAERVLHYIEAEGHDGAVTLTGSRKAWAAELGLSHEALYRCLRRLRSTGVIEIQGQRMSRVTR